MSDIDEEGSKNENEDRKIHQCNSKKKPGSFETEGLDLLSYVF